MLLVILLGLGATSCKTFEIPNLRSHVNLPDGRAYVKYLNTDTEYIMSREDWNAERIGYLCHDQDDFADILRTLEKICLRKSVDCAKDVTERMDRARDIINDM